MPSKVVATESRAAWLKAPALRETMARVERGEATQADVEHLTAAAPPEQRGLMPFVVRATRAVHVLDEARERAVSEVETLMERALASSDLQTAVAALRTIRDLGLLGEPAELRPVGSAIEPGCALETNSNEVVLTDTVIPLGPLPRARVGLVVAASAVPPPEPLDEETEDRIADAIADAFLQQEGL